MIGGYISE